MSKLLAASQAPLVIFRPLDSVFRIVRPLCRASGGGTCKIAVNTFARNFFTVFLPVLLPAKTGVGLD